MGVTMTLIVVLLVIIAVLLLVIGLIIQTGINELIKALTYITEILNHNIGGHNGTTSGNSKD